jgi:hypothetical protein
MTALSHSADHRFKSGWAHSNFWHLLQRYDFHAFCALDARVPDGLERLGLATKTPHGLDDLVIVAKGWIDGAIMVAAGTTVFLGGVTVLKSAK